MPVKVPPYFFSIIRLVNSPNKCAILNPNDSTPPPQQLQAFSPKNYKKFCKGTVDTHSFVSIITQQLGRKVCLRPEKQAAFSFRQQHHHFFLINFYIRHKRCRCFYFYTPTLLCCPVHILCLRYAK